MEKILIIIGAGVLISLVWLIKAKTSYIYYYLAFYPENDTPQKAAWISTLLIAALTSLFIL